MALALRYLVEKKGWKGSVVRTVSTTRMIDRLAARYGLTLREIDEIEMLCCGRTNREISECLGIGSATVKTHLIHIFEKLGVETRSAVVALMSRLH